MLTERQVQQLNAENELLILQLEDVNEIIKHREAELDLLRQTALKATQMQSRLDMNLFEFEQMQNNLGDKQQEAVGTNERLESLEKELYNSIKMERNYLNMLDEKTSLQANLLDTTNELEEAAALYKKVLELRRELTKTKSELEIAKLEVLNLTASYDEAVALNTLLLSKRSL